MSRRERKGELGVEWFLPGKKRRFADTTPATSNLLRVLSEDGSTWAEVLAAIHFDPDAKFVAQTFVNAGLGDRPAFPFMVSRTTDPQDQWVALTPSDLAAVLAGHRPSARLAPLSQRTIRMTIRDLGAMLRPILERAA